MDARTGRPEGRLTEGRDSIKGRPTRLVTASDRGLLAQVLTGIAPIPGARPLVSTARQGPTRTGVAVHGPQTLLGRPGRRAHAGMTVPVPRMVPGVPERTDEGPGTRIVRARQIDVTTLPAIVRAGLLAARIAAPVQIPHRPTGRTQVAERVTRATERVIVVAETLADPKGRVVSAPILDVTVVAAPSSPGVLAMASPAVILSNVAPADQTRTATRRRPVGRLTPVGGTDVTPAARTTAVVMTLAAAETPVIPATRASVAGAMAPAAHGARIAATPTAAVVLVPSPSGSTIGSALATSKARRGPGAQDAATIARTAAVTISGPSGTVAARIAGPSGTVVRATASSAEAEAAMIAAAATPVGVVTVIAVGPARVATVAVVTSALTVTAADTDRHVVGARIVRPMVPTVGVMVIVPAMALIRIVAVTVPAMVPTVGVMVTVPAMALIRIVAAIVPGMALIVGVMVVRAVSARTRVATAIGVGTGPTSAAMATVVDPVTGTSARRLTTGTGGTASRPGPGTRRSVRPRLRGSRLDQTNRRPLFCPTT